MVVLDPHEVDEVELTQLAPCPQLDLALTKATQRALEFFPPVTQEEHVHE